MNLLAIQGSPRKNGNTDIVLDRVLARLRDRHAAQVDKVYAHDLDIGGCNECFACQKVLDAPACAVQDDMQGLYDKMLAADLIVFASPVFCWGVTAQLKAIWDRLYATLKFEQDPYTSLLAGKAAAMIVTAGGDVDDGATAAEEGFTKLFEFARGKIAGTLLAPSLKQPEDTASDAKLLAGADAFADDVAAAVA